MSRPQDQKALSHVYREGAWPEPNRQIEQAIRATERARRSLARRWALPFALAAAALLAFAFLNDPIQEPPRPIAGSPPPGSGARVEQPPVTPDAAKAALKPDAHEAPARPPGASAPARAPAPPFPAAKPPAAATLPPAAATLPSIRKDGAERRSPVPSDAGPKARPPAAEPSPAPPAPRAEPRKEPPERAFDSPTFVPTRPPQAWIEDIRRLKAEGKAGEAALALEGFRKSNPDYVLPEDLR